MPTHQPPCLSYVRQDPISELCPLSTIIARALALVELYSLAPDRNLQINSLRAHCIACAAPLVQDCPWKAVRQPCCATRRAKNTALLVFSPCRVLGRCSLPSKLIYKPNQLLHNGNGSQWCSKKPLVPPCKGGRWAGTRNSHPSIQIHAFACLLLFK